ncbi:MULTISPECIES: NADPH-dependent oxidoreductase [Bacillaceae]|uniref:NADPH-dependent oxidoreductase n=1 Tax=Evansella alkalicola TaxID=745819 RepID=A0ABS6JQI6_9BACI|nr:MULTISPECIES: NADPH-dependent oxidoreductase [Bacillaceae]MBU9719984.1 NADPH-dependent oxidoreductase [Bacillus alkalicola]
MNEVINLLTEHRSYREYKEDPVDQAQVDTIVKAAMSSANWINGQQVTVIEVKDKVKKAKLAELVGNQPYVDQAPVFFVFCLDFYRAKLAAEKTNMELGVVNSVEALLTGSTDVGIAMGNAIAAAESLDLGTVPIGGIRKNPVEVAALLELPEYVFPISGLVLGHPAAKADIKPRLPLAATHQKERYNHEQRPFIDEFDETYGEFVRQQTNGERTSQWSKNIATFYQERYKGFSENVVSGLKKQGFDWEK